MRELYLTLGRCPIKTYKRSSVINPNVPRFSLSVRINEPNYVTTAIQHWICPFHEYRATVAYLTLERGRLRVQFCATWYQGYT